MKRFLIALAVVAIAGATYVAAAPGSQAAGPTAKQFAALKKQVKALNGKVSSLQAKLAADESTISSLSASVANHESTISSLSTTVGNDNSFLTNCLGYVSGLSDFGDGQSGAFGYSYSTDGTNYVLTTAIDFDASGTPDIWVQDVNPSCVHPLGNPSAGGLLERPHAVGTTARH